MLWKKSLMFRLTNKTGTSYRLKNPYLRISKILRKSKNMISLISLRFQ